MPGETDWEALVAEANFDRRTERRLSMAFPIEIYGFDAQGKYFSERTVTSEISEKGCRFRIKPRLEPLTVVAIKLLSGKQRNSPSDKPLLFQIAWTCEQEAGWVCGALKLEKDYLWCVAFPQGSEQNSTAV